MSRPHFRMSLPSPKKIDCAEIKRHGFHDDRILVVDLNDPCLTWPDKLLLEQIGEKLYGKRQIAKPAKPALRMVKNGGQS